MTTVTNSLIKYGSTTTKYRCLSCFLGCELRVQGEIVKFHRFCPQFPSMALYCVWEEVPS